MVLTFVLLATQFNVMGIRFTDGVSGCLGCSSSPAEQAHNSTKMQLPTNKCNFIMISFFMFVAKVGGCPIKIKFIMVHKE